MRSINSSKPIYCGEEWSGIGSLDVGREGRVRPGVPGTVARGLSRPAATGSPRSVPFWS